MAKKRKPKKDDPEQSHRFVETAREHVPEDNDADFQRTMRKIAQTRKPER